MRTPQPPILTTHRLARLNAWARLWLVWFVGVCAKFAATNMDRRRPRRHAPMLAGEGAGSPYFLSSDFLDCVAHMARNIIVINAAARYRPPPRAAHRHGRLKRASLRMIAGSPLRRALSGKDWPSRLMAIVAFIRDADAHVARLLRRLKSGLTRLRVLLPQRCADPLAPFSPANGAPCADTS